MNKWVALLAMIGLALLSGCGAQNNSGSVAISVSPTTANVAAGQTQQFTATVSGSSNTGVTWSVAGTGCSGATCGTVSATGLYAAPASVPNPATVVVTATAQADTSKSATATVTILAPLPVTVSITPRVVNVLISATARFTATVANAANTGVTWSLSGTGCAGTGCGTLVDGVYTAPAVVPSSPVVTVTATSQADPSKSASATVTIVATPTALLSGNYAFLFNGFDAIGAFAEIGTLSFDGRGGLQGTSHAQHAFGSNAGGGILTGSYTVGSDNRGQFTTSLFATTRTFQFAYSPSGEIHFIEFDNSTMRGAGVMKPQEGTGLSGSTPLNADYVLALNGGDGTGARIGFVGRVHLGTDGSLSGNYDVVRTGEPGSGQLSGNYLLNVNGEGQAQIIGLGRSLNWAFVFVNRSETFWIMDGSTDPVFSLLSGIGREQSGGPFSIASLNGSLVFGLTGKNGAGTTVEAGRLVFNGAGGLTGVLDLNDGGLITNDFTFTGTYTLSATGRGTFGTQAGPRGQNGQLFVFYAAQPGEAYLLQTGGGTQTMTGLAETQSGPFSTAILAGNYAFGSLEPGVNIATLRSGSATVGTNISGTIDTSTGSTLAVAETLAAQLQNLDATTGRAPVLVTSPATSNFVLYAIAPGKFLLVPTTSGSFAETILKVTR